MSRHVYARTRGLRLELWVVCGGGRARRSDLFAPGANNSPAGCGRRVRDAELTPLQSGVLDIHLGLEGARHAFTPEGYRAYVWIGCDLFGRAAAELVVHEALEAAGEDEEAA